MKGILPNGPIALMIYYVNIKSVISTIMKKANLSEGRDAKSRVLQVKKKQDSRIAMM